MNRREFLRGGIAGVVGALLAGVGVKLRPDPNTLFGYPVAISEELLIDADIELGPLAMGFGRQSAQAFTESLGITDADIREAMEERRQP